MTETIATDVAIVGGGPAGIAAALALRSRGVQRVTILERETDVGGVPRHCGHPPFGMREFGRVLTGPAYARRLAEAARQAGVEIRTGLSVTALRPEARLDATTAAGPVEIAAGRVVLATGARESSRAARLISGDRPVGVITTGTLQHEVHIEKMLPFRCPVIVGTELVSLSAVATCRKAGIRPVAVVEAADRPTARRPLDLFPRLLGIPMHYRATIAEIRGRGRVEAIAIRLADGSMCEIACDGVLLTGRFTPEAALVRPSHLVLDDGSGGPAIDQFGRCSDPSYFAAGNLLRPIETAGWSYREGARIGAMVADDLAGTLPPCVTTTTIVGGANVKLVVPQRLSASGHTGSLDSLQIRVEAATTGPLVARDGSQVLWRRNGRLLPERRILIPLSALQGPRAAGGTIIIEAAGSGSG
jgi:NADPH-dependent 2,4-dienoyl-CoA reductase/sulfur reductase-like enzyme